MKADKILFIDTETGGIDPAKDSLLSLALLVWAEGEVRGAIEILINDGVLHVTEQALAINGIDLEEHRRKAVEPKMAIRLFDDFLKQHFKDDEQIVIGGHNVGFDVNFLNAFLTRYGSAFKARFSHRHVDTSSILFYLYLTGKIRRKIVSSQDAFDYFGIAVEGRHTALGDVKATAELFSRLIGILYREGKGRRKAANDPTDLFTTQEG